MAKGNHANLTTKITAKKINLGEMLKKLEISQDLDGVLDLNINLKGQGKSVAALKTAGEGTPKATAKSGKEIEQKGTREKKKEGLGSKIKNLFSKPKQ